MVGDRQGENALGMQEAMTVKECWSSANLTTTFQTRFSTVVFSAALFAPHLFHGPAVIFLCSSVCFAVSRLCASFVAVPTLYLSIACY
jgi:hypothetical protein